MSWAHDTTPGLVRINPPPIWKLETPWKCESIPPPSQLHLKFESQYARIFDVKIYPEDTILECKKQIKAQGNTAIDKQRIYIHGAGYCHRLSDDTVVGTIDANIEQAVLGVFLEK